MLWLTRQAGRLRTSRKGVLRLEVKVAGRVSLCGEDVVLLRTRRQGVDLARKLVAVCVPAPEMRERLPWWARRLHLPDLFFFFKGIIERERERDIQVKETLAASKVCTIGS